MGRHGENTDSALGHVTEQPGPALKLRNVGPLRGWRGPHFQDLGHHCQSGAGAEPLPAHCSQHCGHMFAMPTGRIPSSPSSPCSHCQDPHPYPFMSRWKWTSFVPMKFPGAALTLRKQRSLAEWRDPLSEWNSDSGQLSEAVLGLEPLVQGGSSVRI